MTKATAMAALRRTKDRAEFISLLRAKGVDVVLRETDTGCIYGATFIDHRTGCVLNGSRMGKELSANALQEHFEPPEAGGCSRPKGARQTRRRKPSCVKCSDEKRRRKTDVKFNGYNHATRR